MKKVKKNKMKKKKKKKNLCHKNGSGTFAQICKLESPETDAATLGKKQMELLQNVVRFSF